MPNISCASFAGDVGTSWSRTITCLVSPSLLQALDKLVHPFQPFEERAETRMKTRCLRYEGYFFFFFFWGGGKGGSKKLITSIYT